MLVAFISYGRKNVVNQEYLDLQAFAVQPVGPSNDYCQLTMARINKYYLILSVFIRSKNLKCHLLRK